MRCDGNDSAGESIELSDLRCFRQIGQSGEDQRMQEYTYRYIQLFDRCSILITLPKN